ncbi:MAG: phosphatidylserine/phosphatidylglycerophosphate/cardiolipin synthase family protein [Deltaproteobacteria bacterium]|nr:phosphatidylserine/phosphatidylglycerophosphate/cardiolipin synthase family protein [Deltaproteobacteria bacterium]
MTSIQWNEETLYDSGDKFFGDLLAAISKAQSSIEFETYIFNDDSLGRKIAEAFKGAAARGVHVRVLVDGIGAPNWVSRFMPDLSLAGVENRVYHPVPWISRIGMHERFARAGLLLRLFGRLNRRNHRKTCVTDGGVNEGGAWVGSMNVANNHLESRMGDHAWRDAAVRVRGTEVAALREAFERAWASAWYPGKKFKLRIYHEPPGLRLLRLNHTRLTRLASYRELLFRIRSARDRVWITNAYFVPRTAFVSALARAARNGADVRLLVPGKSDVPFMAWVTSTFYRQLLGTGVRIYEYLPSMLHAKTLIVDDWAEVGSSNLNHRSLLHDLEVDVVLSFRDTRERLGEHFRRDLTRSREVTLERIRSRPLWLQVLASIILKLRYWL